MSIIPILILYFPFSYVRKFLSHSFYCSTALPFSRLGTKKSAPIFTVNKIKFSFKLISSRVPTYVKNCETSWVFKANAKQIASTANRIKGECKKGKHSNNHATWHTSNESIQFAPTKLQRVCLAIGNACGDPRSAQATGSSSSWSLRRGVVDIIMTRLRRCATVTKLIFNLTASGFGRGGVWVVPV